MAGLSTTQMREARKWVLTQAPGSEFTLGDIKQRYPHCSASKAIQCLSECGLVVRVGRGKYQLPDK